MFEKLRPDPEGGPISSTAFNLLSSLGFYHEEISELQEPPTPEPLTAIIGGVRWDFEDKDTYLAVCEENPELSCIVRLVLDESGDIENGHCFYDQPDLMEKMEKLGFAVVPETLEEAEMNHQYFAPADEFRAGQEINLN
ncbi:MAG TPA: hypothetical protein VFK11_00245 [Candidatus Saccharimonadales bacterium]|nr:hypothetical protein [Candidatus Saccharimonadales bacterium]